ncbi:hypothetical protein HETIRDRAFT_428431 [Heterobasidion irregulare TC 32-1]|uniref:CHAT domain-containing protein n=1 Tax=Heterobasidion irregulare (strain TC 32-1) TaxID=747525 RepID=W4K372_HETIT|nr:uncharacterized protein HETIRDRAFT_428431 [Heterobasidion irregulare TC 32-1]ETW80194.1 hypothetical protein HETIRDRAFT_428431 [Heterobasidion irregulare TC 32-1]
MDRGTRAVIVSDLGDLSHPSDQLGTRETVGSFIDNDRTYHFSQDHDETEELVASIVREYKGASHLSSLETALYFLRKYLALCLGDHSIQPNPLDNPAPARLVRFNWTGEIRDLDEAILLIPSKLTGVTLPQNSIRAQPEIEVVTEREQRGERDIVLEHEHEALSMIKFVLGVVTEFCNSGSISSIEAAIYLYRQVVNQRGHQNPKRFAAITEAFTEATLLRLQHQNSDMRDAKALNLAEHGADIARSFTSEDITEVNSSIFFFQEAVGMMCEEHPLRCHALIDLASTILVRFLKTGRRHDLDRARLLLEEAEDREKAISMYGKSLMICLVPHPNRSALLTPHPDRSASLNNLGNAVRKRFEKTGQVEDLEQAISLHRDSLALCPAPHPYRLAYMNNLACALLTRFDQIGQAEDLEDAISLHRTSLMLSIPQYPHRNSRDLEEVHFKYTGQVKDLDEAIMLQREALKSLPEAHPDRCRILHHLASNDVSENALGLFRAAVRCENASILDRSYAARSWAQHADELKHASALEAYQAAIRFLPLVSMLVSRIKSRPQLLATKLDSHPPNDTTACAIRIGAFGQAIELLEEGKAVFWSQAFKLRTPFDDLRQVHPDLAKKLQDMSQALERSSLHDHPETIQDDARGVMTIEAEAGSFRRLHENWLETLELIRGLDGFGEFLRPKKFTLLKQAISGRPIVLLNAAGSSSRPVIFALKLNVKSELPPRVWWCPTGYFTFLPIHAAGIYSPDMGDLENVSDYMISSYTPTLNTLLVPPPAPSTDAFKMLVAIQPETPGYSCLPSTRDEMQRIEAHAPSSRLIEQCSSSASQWEMWLFPTKLLTFVGTMLFSGFRGVVGTMWSIHDVDGPMVADEFYGHLFQGPKDGSHPDTTQAARALHLAVTKLRACLGGKSFLRWVPFVHYGL